MKRLKNSLVLPILLMVFNIIGSAAQSLQHPHIWVTQSDKQEILNNIEKYSWASSFYNQLKNRVDSKVNTHKTNPAFILSTIRSVPGVSGDRSAHTDMLTYASEAAVLYYLTNDGSYAQYAADVLSHYTDRLSVVDSIKYKNSTTGVFFGDWWLESRALFPKIAIVYDFVYDFVNNPTTTVYDVASKSRKTFDNTAAQTTVKKLAAIVFKSVSASHSNHSVLAGNGALFNCLMVDDDVTRESFFNRYYKGLQKDPFDPYTWTLGNFSSQNIWDETFGYSKDSHVLVLQTLNIIDRYKPELDIINKNVRILDGYPFYENYFYPSGAVFHFGDTGDEEDLRDGYQRILKIATRKNMPDYINTSKQALKFKFDETGGYRPKVETESLEWSNPLDLLWAVNVEDTVTAQESKLSATQVVKHAGLVIQRNYNTTDIKNDAMMYYSGGATYVHTHRTGIDLNLYGKGYVLGAESGSASYGTDEHENYRVRLAAHNTVITNGSGKSGTTWDTRMSNVSLVASEPNPNEEAISPDFSFSTQYINDVYNFTLQQRTNSIIRTSATSGYYFDVFRSKGRFNDSYHDFIYHNIGDAVSLTYEDNSAVPLSASTKYASDGVGSVTGWTFFENVKSSAQTSEAVFAKFALNSVNRYMNVFIPAGISREYATALAPTTKGAESGYDSKKTPVLTMRKNGEAWDAPFVAIYEPTDNSVTTVKNAQNLSVNNRVVGARVQSTVGQKLITDYIISNDEETQTITLADEEISFTGRFAIVRIEEQNKTERISLYIGQGSKLRYKNDSLSADEKKQGYLIVGELDTTFVKTTIEIEAEDFDEGGEGVAYHDRESSNKGTEKDYRASEGVDLYKTADASNGIVVGSVRSDEWMNYTFSVDKVQSYYLGVLASNLSYTGASFNAYLDDVLIVEKLKIGVTGNWDVYSVSEASNSFLIDSGEHTLRIAIKVADFRLDKIILRKDLLYNAVKNTPALEAKVFPNPCKSYFSIELKYNNNAEYALYSLKGTQVMKGMFINKTTIPTNELLSGVYMLQIVSNNSRTMFKIVINS